MKYSIMLLTLSGTSGSLLLCLTFSCVIPSGTVTDELKMSIADTVAPFGNVTVQFNCAVEDSILTMRLLPNDIILTASMNSSNDKAIFTLPLSTSGCSDFMLIPQTGNSSQENGISDTLIFRTWPRENEPNNSVETADSIISRIYGTVSTIDDIDWYVIDSAYVTKCVLKNYGGTAELRVARNPGSSTIDESALDTEIVTFTSNVKDKAFIMVNTPLKAAGGYYEITIQQ